MPSKPLTIGEIQQKLATDPRSLTIDELRAMRELEKIKRQKDEETRQAEHPETPRRDKRDLQYEKMRSVIFSDIQPDRPAKTKRKSRR